MTPTCVACGALWTDDNGSPSAVHCDKCFAAIWREKDAQHAIRPATPPAPTVDAGTARALRIVDEMIAECQSKYDGAAYLTDAACFNTALLWLKDARQRIAQETQP